MLLSQTARVARNKTKRDSVICIHCIMEENVGKKQEMQTLTGGFLLGHQHLNNNDPV